VLFMASEQKFWKDFCSAIGREDLFAAKPGEKLASHALGDLELRRELAAIFATKTTAQWVAIGQQHDITISPVNTPETIAADRRSLVSDMTTAFAEEAAAVAMLSATEDRAEGTRSLMEGRRSNFTGR
jgi:crotonobetainyl-CoA:carnitine CoA-transferase CaiB-like acyl-CoA transferase